MSLEEALDGCAKMAVSLHRSGIRLGRRRMFNDEINATHEEIKLMELYLPNLGRQFEAWLKQVSEIDDSYAQLPLAFSHGDFRYTQLSSDGEYNGLVDFDTVCQAEPALDVGQFLAYQRLTIRKEQNPEQPFSPEATEAICAKFFDTYVDETRDWLKDEVAFRARVQAYELITLIRFGVHSWKKLKGSRLDLTLDLLEERIPCLKQLT
jgi:thiamine kinase-like enzyme